MKMEETQHTVSTLHDALDDLSCRFLLNLPTSEFESFERLFFAIESAHWFYEDFFREKNKDLPQMSMKDFAAALFAHTPLLQPYKEQVDNLFEAFRNYKQEVPKCGAAMLNPRMDRVLLVLGWGSKGRWSFPKGKLGKDESELDCAIREVDEETGFNFSDYARANDFLDYSRQNVKTRLFIVPNVPESTLFEPRTRKEIARIEWHTINDLPEDYTATKASKYYTVVPFVRRLKAWVRKRKGGAKKDSDGGKGQFTDGVDNRRTPAKKRQQGDASQVDMRASPGRGKGKGKPRRDEVTFGTPETALNDRDRERLFQQYVEEAERRREVIDTSEYDRIVDSITYGNAGAAAGASPGRGRGKSKAWRDKVTFGTPDTALNDEDRERLFQRYVEEAERRREAIDTSEYYRIVDSITYGNSGAAKRAAQREESDRSIDSASSRERAGSASQARREDNEPSQMSSFSFARTEILNCFS